MSRKISFIVVISTLLFVAQAVPVRAYFGEGIVHFFFQNFNSPAPCESIDGRDLCAMRQDCEWAGVTSAQRGSCRAKEQTSEALATLTIGASGTGSGTVNTVPFSDLLNCGKFCEQSLPIGREITLKAFPDQASLFAGWDLGNNNSSAKDNCGTTNGECTIVLKRSLKVIARFEQRTKCESIDGRDLCAMRQDCEWAGVTSAQRGSCRAKEQTSEALATLTIERGGEGSGTVEVFSDILKAGREQQEPCNQDTCVWRFPVNASLLLSARVHTGDIFAGWENVPGDWGNADCKEKSGRCTLVLHGPLRMRARFDRANASFFTRMIQSLFDSGKIKKNAMNDARARALEKHIKDSPQDVDRDGLSGDEEARLGTSDVEIDTDHDGLSDYNEVRVWHTNPTKADTDGDGYGDGYEVLNGYDPNGAGKLKK